MAWFSGGLSQFSNLTDQLSNFTKEVLTETTEEVEDPGAELQVAKKRVADLEKLNEHILSEYEKLKAHNEELNERVETAECQIGTISQEYRKMLVERDEELKRCKVENEKLREEQKHFVQGAATHSPLKELAGGQFFHNGGMFENVDISEGRWGDEFHDFSDVVNSQGEINRLQSELAKLKVECQHWKDAAKEKVPQSETEVNESLLNEQIKGLQSSLQHQVDQHQHELSSLQSIHSERMHSLTARHQQEVEQLQRQISQLNTQSTLGRSSDRGESPHELSARCIQLEQEIARLKENSDANKELEQMHKEQTQECDSLKVLNSQFRHDIERLVEEKNNLEMKLAEMVTILKKENAREINELDGERKQLQSQLDQLQTTISHHQDVISKLQKEHIHSQSKVKQLQSNIESLEEQTRTKENEIFSLKTTCEDTAKLRRELEEKSLLLDASRQTVEELEVQVENKESELQALNNHIRVLQGREVAKMAELENKFVQDREVLLQNMSKLKAPVEQSSTEQSAAPEDLGQVQKLTANMLSLTKENEELTKQLLAKEKVVNDLSDSVKQYQEIVNERESKQTMVIEQDMSQSDKLQTELNSLQESKAAVVRELQGKQEECVKYSKQLGQLRAHLLEVEETYTQEALKSDEREVALKNELSQLKEKLQSTAKQDATQSRYTQDQLARVQDELQSMVEQRDDALLQMANAQEQAHQNAIALRNLQTVLEQFQRDQSSELAEALKRSQNELADARQECLLLRTEHAQIETKLLEANRFENEVLHLNQKLSDKEKMIVELSVKVEGLNHSLEERKKDIEKFLLQDNESVDRSLVKNLVLGYVHATDAKKPEVLHLISKILGFSEEELAQALGRGRSGGWLRGLWGKPTPQVHTQESLSQLFVKFLQSESSPQSATPTVTVTTPSLIPGYVDSRTDPDRPSLATAAVLGSHPLPHHPVSPYISTADQSVNSRETDSTVDRTSSPKHSSHTSRSIQSTVLSSVLDSNC